MYRSLSRIYEGARFSVLRGRGDDDHTVVIKQASGLHPEQREAELLAHECAMLGRLEMSGVPRVIEWTTLEGAAALVLEDVGPRTIAETIHGGPLTLDSFLKLAPQMARIVGGVHARNMIHRDICSENFVLDESGAKIALVDFDLATAVPAFAETAGMRESLEGGSLAYMAPENAGRIKRNVDRRADLYALGATFYAMLAAHPPFVAADPLELAHAHAARAPAPLATVNPSVPAVLSDIVGKLLAKMPEWRYQTAESLAADLEEAEHQWRARGRIAPFELGRRDLPFGLVIAPGTLYGREREVAIVEGAVGHAQDASAEVVLVRGVAGIGKSALVNQAREHSGAGVRWLVGKGDLLQGNVPHRPLIEAVRGFVQALSSESEEDVTALRERVSSATAPNGRVLVDAIPDLAMLLGDSPSVLDVGAREAENRFRLTFAAFMRGLVGGGGAVVLFLDDLQWFDPASLEVVRTIAEDRERRSLLVVGAYRSEEVDPDHPVTHFVDVLHASPARVLEVELGPLGPDAVLAFVSDALRVDADRARKLAEVIARKTAANPFLVRQFLGFLYREGLLVLDESSGQWSWDLGGIAAAGVVPNLVDLLAKTVNALPDEARQALGAAACVGDRFELGLLAGVRDEPLDATAHALWVPIDQGLIVPATEARFEWARGRPIELGAVLAPAFRFVHDRIQQAAYTSLPDRARRTLHRKIGRWIEEHVPERSFDAAVETIADQFNRAGEELPEGDRARVAGLNERAGRKARAAAAYASALGYFRTGLSLLPPEARHELWFSLLKGAAECAGLTGEHVLSQGLVDAGLSQTEVPLERAELHAIGILTNTLRNRHADALRHAREGLAVLGMDLPDQATSEVARAECVRAHAALRERTDAQLLTAPPSGDPVDGAKQKLLMMVVANAFFSDPNLYGIVACRAAALATATGSTRGAATAYVSYAVVLGQNKDYREGYRFGRLALSLSERVADPGEQSHVLVVLALHVNAWRAPFEEVFPLLQRAYARGMEGGAIDLAGYARMELIHARFFVGTELGQVHVEAQSSLAYQRQLHHAIGTLGASSYLQAIKALLRLTRDRTTFDDDQFDEVRHLADPAGLPFLHGIYHILRLQVAYLLGQAEVARTHATRATPSLPYLGGHFVRTNFHFYAGLTLAHLASGAEPGDRKGLLATVREHLGHLETWSQNAPMNFAHKRELVAAELARVEDRAAEAIALYQAAIEHAGRHGFPHEEALAHELCGRFLRAGGAVRVGDLHLGAAMQGYSRWGARAKVAALEEEFESLRAGVMPRYVSTPRELDYLSLVKLAETLTEELVLDRLLEKLLRTCAQTAGAQRVVAVLDEGGFFVRATLTAPSDVVLEKRPLASSATLPVSLIEDVFASRDVLVLGDAAREGRYRTDPYVSAHGVRSVLALPILRADRILGVLYFENNLARDALPAERIEALRLLSSTIAITIENSRLFEERRRSESALGLLAKASAELVETLDYEEVLAKLASLAVPAFADWAVVDVTEDGATSPVSWAHADPNAARCIEELHRKYPIEASAERPPSRVLRSGKSLLIPEMTDEDIRSQTREGDERRLVTALKPRSAIICPLVARGRRAGVVSFASTHPTDRYDAADLALAEELVRRMGLAIDNARLHRNLQKSVSQLQATIEATADGILVVDADRKVTLHNRRLLEMWHIPADRTEGGEERKLFEHVLDQIESADEFVRRMDERHADPQSDRVDRVAFKDGRVFERYSKSQRIGDAIVGRVWSFRDVSERERQLRQTLFLSEATRLLASLDVESALRSVARLAVPSIGHGCAIDLFGENGPRRLIALAEDEAQPFSPEVHPQVLGGRSLIYQYAKRSYMGISISVKRDLVGAMTLCAAPDRPYTQKDLELAEEVTRRAGLAIDNARLYDDVQGAVRARDEFLGIAAHEIRGPLNGIYMAVQAIRKSKEPTPASPKLLDIIEREVQRLAGFVAKLIELVRIRGGSFHLEREPVDLAQIVRDVVARLEAHAARTGSSLEVTTHGELVGEWDKDRLDQVVYNLVSNAVKFGRGKPIELAITGHDSRVELAVRDQGTGMAPEVRERIFKRFERGVSRRQQGGLGLGLYIVKTIVEASGGSVAVESEAGVGSTFRVELPKTPQADGHDERRNG
jgi:predicted ATPase/signal transduction histidine kinase